MSRKSATYFYELECGWNLRISWNHHGVKWNISSGHDIAGGVGDLERGYGEDNELGINSISLRESRSKYIQEKAGDRKIGGSGRNKIPSIFLPTNSSKNSINGS